MREAGSDEEFPVICKHGAHAAGLMPRAYPAHLSHLDYTAWHSCQFPFVSATVVLARLVCTLYTYTDPKVSTRSAPRCPIMRPSSFSIILVPVAVSVAVADTSLDARDVKPAPIVFKEKPYVRFMVASTNIAYDSDQAAVIDIKNW